MQRNRKHPRDVTGSQLGLPRVRRRTALQGLGALAVTGLGCSSGRSAAGSVPGTAASAAMPTVGSGGPAQSSVPSDGSSGALPITGSAGAPGTAGAAAASPTQGAAGMGMAATPASAANTGGMPANAGAAGVGGSASATGLDALNCIVTPAMTDGPFFVDEGLNRSSLIMGETDAAIANAVPLKLVIGVYAVSGMACKPLAGVQVDIWQANAIGVYSDVTPGLVQSVDTRGKKFLRGYQLSDAQGVVRFDTIYPGWYMSRTIHIHFKLRMLDSSVSAREFTSQMFFDEAINAAVLANAPYSSRSDTRAVLNDDDHIYNGTAMNGQRPPAGTSAPGKSIMPALAADGAGYTATLKIGVMS